MGLWVVKIALASEKQNIEMTTYGLPKGIRNVAKAAAYSSPLWITGVILLGWGIYTDGWIRIGISVVFIFLSVMKSINRYRLDRKTEKWLSDHEGKLVFFYATTKKTHERIRSEILPLFEPGILQVYYDGPKLVGHIKSTAILISMMNSDVRIRPHNPVIIKIENGTFVIKDELNLLMEIEKAGVIDYQTLKARIKEACG